MSEYDGRVVYRVEADTSGVDDAINQTERSFKESGNGITEMFGKLAKGFAGLKVVQFLKGYAQGAVGLASSLAEVQNVVDVTFGDGAATIETWSKNAGLQFGLTEIQAKNFTSTLGAMMKSAGLAGPEIVTMSTDLAGLAADMASFYNMDFETAFSKIRSGLAGVTMPLQQLGINMSETNLQAFALTKGITKSFDKMSQGEKTLLRYQYLMSVTADAQGDFARTSDGLANASRQLETNLNTIQANIGKLLEPAVRTATGLLAELTTALVFGNDKKQKTVLDEIATIDLNAQAKINDIEKTKDKAVVLLSVLQDIDAIDPGAKLTEVANGASELKSADVTPWNELDEHVSNIAGTRMNSDAVKTIQQSADRLTDTGNWDTLKDSVQSIADTKLADDDGNPLSAISDSASELTQEAVKPWKDYSEALAQITGALNEGAGKTGNGVAAEGAEDANKLAEISAKLGISIDGITDSHSLWLATCKQLVQTIPGLSSIINVETGEIQGGTDAVLDYVNAWEKLEKGKVMWNALNQKKTVIDKEFSDMPSLMLDASVKRRQYTNWLKANGLTDEDISSYAKKGLGTYYAPGSGKTFNLKDVLDMRQAADDAERSLVTRSAALKEASSAWDEERKVLLQLHPELADYFEETEAAATATEELKDKVKAAEDALKAVGDYIDKTREDVMRGLDGAASGFEELKTPAQQARENVTDLKKALSEAQDEASRDELGKTLKNAQDNADKAIKSIEGMNRGIESQIAYYDEYDRRIQAAKANGVSDEVLAALSDGSQASFDYLETLGTASESEVTRLNNNYARLGQSKNTLAETLTQQKLLVDQTFEGLVQTAQDAVKQLDQSEAAGNAASTTVQGIIDGLNSKYPELVSAVDAVIAQISRLSGLSWFNFGLSGLGISSGRIGTGATPHAGLNATPLAIGMDYVPFDGFLASLHEGEGVLTAEENRAWQAFKNGGASTANNIDYGRLSGAIWENAPSMGGNVYLDGQTVGRVMSAQQAESLRTLTRSGWRG